MTKAFGCSIQYSRSNHQGETIMLRKNSRLGLRSVSLVAIGAATLMTAGSAVAAEKLYGGGSTSPVPAFVGEAYLATTPDSRLSTNAGNNAGIGFQTAIISPGSVFAAYTAATTNQISYCQTGSGFGKTALNGSVANLACRDYTQYGSPPTDILPAGFSAVAATPDFTATDIPISTTDYNNFIAGSNAATRTAIVQIPVLAGAIALPYNDSVNSVPVVNLAIPNICRIYSGLIKDWSGVFVNGGTPVGNGPIRIVYRSDGSGTTLAFTSYLASECNNRFGVPANFFMPNQVFASAITGGVAIYANSIGVSGNSAVVAQTKTNNNALGYADFGEVDSQAARYVTVNGYDPAQFGDNSLGFPAPITTTFLRGQVLNGATTAAAPAVIPVNARNCLILIHPTTAISNRYPIAAFIYLNGYYAGNGGVLHIDAIKQLYMTFYKLPFDSRPVLPTGFAYLDGSVGGVVRSMIAGGTVSEPGCVF
jgi:phosphate transport system substrate-binding protein